MDSVGVLPEREVRTADHSTVSSEFKVIREHVQPRVHGEMLGKLASCFFYVREGAFISDLAEDFEKLPKAYGVGVVDKHGIATGVVLRKSVFAMLGKRYGHDIYSKKPVKKIEEHFITYDFQRNLFSIADEMEKSLGNPGNEYYLITQRDNHFYALFTKRDMLVYLSSITQKDIALARSLQQSIVPESIEVKEREFNAAGRTRMAKGVGGDYYYIHKTGEEKWVFILCDVSGKGVSASLVTTSLSGMVSIYDFQKGIENLLRKLNEYIFQSFESQKFVTGVVVELDTWTGEVQLYDVGHSLVYLSRGNKFYKIKSKNDILPMGISGEMKLKADRVVMKPGDLLVLITDGILEQTGASGEEFGEKKLSTLIRNFRLTGINNLEEKIFDEILVYRGNQPQHDDMTMLLVEYRG